MPEVGKAAPAFTAEDQSGRSVAFPPKGQWAVLAFYPRAATPG
jgi:peroxiredoxin